MADITTAVQSQHHLPEAHCRLCLETSKDHEDCDEITENVNKTILEIFPPEVSLRKMNEFVTKPHFNVTL